ncbi:MAG: hypothetical protein U1E70_22990 [Acetobacteraceae bacterium]|nr:hypothetical protein [Pseudomonadota bacterium]
MRKFMLAVAAATGLFAATAAGASAAPPNHAAASAVDRGLVHDVYYGDGYYRGGDRYYRGDYPRRWHRHWDNPRYAYEPRHHPRPRYWEHNRWYYR